MAVIRGRPTTSGLLHCDPRMETPLPFEIWQHRASGERYLVAVRNGVVNVAAGPPGHHDDPATVLETHGNQHHNALALLDMRRNPNDYRSEYMVGTDYHAVRIKDTPPSAK